MLRDFLILLLFYASIESVSGLSCYQCNSTLSNNCIEDWDHTIEDHPIKPQICTINQAQYCIKITQLWGGIVGTHRFCSAKHLGNRCQIIKYPDHDRQYRACVETCSKDNCNSADTYFSSRTLTLIFVSVLVSLRLMKF